MNLFAYFCPFSVLVSACVRESEVQLPQSFTIFLANSLSLAGIIGGPLADTTFAFLWGIDGTVGKASQSLFAPA